MHGEKQGGDMKQSEILELHCLHTVSSRIIQFSHPIPTNTWYAGLPLIWLRRPLQREGTSKTVHSTKMVYVLCILIYILTLILTAHFCFLLFLGAFWKKQCYQTLTWLPTDRKPKLFESLKTSPSLIKWWNKYDIYKYFQISLMYLLPFFSWV